MNSSELYSDAEEMTLREWNFIKDFQGVQQYFTAILRGLRLGAAEMGEGQLPTDHDAAKWLELVLEKDLIFDKIVKQKLYIRPDKAVIFRSMFARYVVTKSWGEL